MASGMHSPSLRRALPWLLALVSFGCSSTGPTARGMAQRRGSAYQKTLQARLATRLAREDAGLHVGIHVVGVSDAQTIYSKNSKERFVPASTVKVLTAAAALHTLGPQYRFLTELAVDDMNRTTHTVRNVYLRGSGDPSFSLGDLQMLAVALKQQGISRITGELVIDDTAFDNQPWARGWMWDDLGDGFSAAISGVNVAGNALSLLVAPSRVGQPLRVQTQPSTRFVSVSSQATTGAAATANSLRFNVGGEQSTYEGPPLPPDAFRGTGDAGRQASDLALMLGQQVQLQGSLAENSPMRQRRFAVRSPAAYASMLLREQLQMLHIEPPGTWRRGATPPTAQVVASHASAELANLLFEALKSSNNHVLECVLKRLGAQTTQEAGSFASGTQAVRRFLSEVVGIRGGEPVLLDGSGASRYNLVTPEHMTQVLVWAAQSFSDGPELLVGLPLGGVDGTLSHRQRGALRGRVRAKTGTMTGVSGLCGLLLTDDGEQLAFAILIDHDAAPSENARVLQDDILAILAGAAQ